MDTSRDYGLELREKMKPQEPKLTRKERRKELRDKKKRRTRK